MSLPSPAEWGERLRRLRNERDLSQMELTDRARVSQTTVSAIETGKQRPDTETQVALAVALEVEPAIPFPRSDREIVLATHGYFDPGWQP